MTNTKPTIDELIASFSVTDAGKSVVGKAILASLERLKRLDSQPVPVEPRLIKALRTGCSDAMQVAIDHIDALQSALKLAQEERDELSDRMARVRHSADKFAEQAEKAEAELAALQLIGEVKEGGVVWLNQNPHAYPIGTKFYCIQE